MSRTALVTGGAVRVGRAIALGLAEEGFRLAVHYNRSSGPAEGVVEEIEAGGGAAASFQADLSQSASAGGLIRQVEERFGDLHALVNSASIYRPDTISEGTDEAWELIQAINVRAPFQLVREAAPLLTRTGGCVVNIVDLSAFQVWNRFGIHSVSKTALLKLTRVQARTLAPSVRVNAVAPGNVLPPEDDSEEEIEASRRRVPLGRIGDPTDVVGAVRYLVNAPYVTGEVVVVDGGRLLEP
ncbi:MAG: SDR family oxidoreductase [Gemmatimonadetes bacterium]|nr:SDR family oxidoreductase [Gemmatimonadota bacterium]